MTEEAMLFFRIVCISGAIVTLLAGIFLFKNSERLFGSNPDHPSENSSGRLYAKFLVFAAWAHAMVLFTLGALKLH